MSHGIFIKALEFVKHAHDYADTNNVQYAVSLLMTQRQIFNTLAPILPSKGILTTFRGLPELYYRLLMRADTFRFATSLHAIYGMTTELVQELLSKMDCVIEVALRFSDSVDNQLTPTLLALPHLERVSLPLFMAAMTYEGTLRPLLRHPRESVRRSVAASAGSSWFGRLSPEQLIAMIRDDIVPLLDSASCNAVVVDYLHLTYASLVVRMPNPLQPPDRLPQDIVMLLGERLFQFFTAANSHSELIEKSLEMLCELADEAAGRGNDLFDLEVPVDVFKEWPVLESLPDMLRRGVLMTDGKGIEAVLLGIFHHQTMLPTHRQRFFELQILDIMYDSCLTRTGRSPFRSCEQEMRFVFAVVARADPVAFLTRTNVMQKELQNFWIPLHHEVKADLLRLQRRGEPCVLAVVDTDDFLRRTAAARFIVHDMITLEMCESDEASDLGAVLRLLLDENALNTGPLLRSYVVALRNFSSSGRIKYTDAQNIELFLRQCHMASARDRFFAFAAREDVNLPEARLSGTTWKSRRWYLSDLLDSLGELR